MTATMLFAASYALVFLLGLQQLFVHQRRYLLSAVNGVLICVAQLALFKLVPFNTSGLELAAFLMGGPAGICSAMWLHDRIVRHLNAPDVIMDLLADGQEHFGLDLIAAARGKLSRGTIYVHLVRLQERGLVTSRLADTHHSWGRSRSRLYRRTDCQAAPTQPLRRI